MRVARRTVPPTLGRTMTKLLRRGRNDAPSLSMAGGLFETACVEGDSHRWAFLAAGGGARDWDQRASGGEVG